MTAAPETVAPLPRPRGRDGRRLWAGLITPGLVWMIVFFLIGLGVMFLLSFGITDDIGQPIFSTTLANYQAVFDPIYLEPVLRSLAYSVITVILCLLIGYPVAYVIALHGGRYRTLLIGAIVLPFFANYLVRMYGWSTLLNDDGVVNGILRATGLSEGIQFLNTPGAVVGGLVYGFIVFMILPIYAVLERMDRSLIEAGRDLYGSGPATFWHVTLPMSRVGVASGCVLVMLPAMGDFVSAQLLGGPGTLMIGSVISSQFLESQNLPLGAALTVVLMVLLMAGTLLYLRFARRAEASVTE